MVSNQLCPCGTGDDYSACCATYISLSEYPPTAEALMRSRYTAYVQNNEDYLLQTWHASTRPAQLDLVQDKPVKWIGLKILAAEASGSEDSEGTVEFVARYKLNGKAHRLHEKSRFVREDGQWFYLAGELKDK